MPVRGPFLVAVLTFIVPFSAVSAQTQHDTTATHHGSSAAHPPYARVPYVLVPDSVRNWFAARWDDTSTTQMEAGGCLMYRREVTPQDDTLYWVTSATDATPRYDSQRAIDFSCPRGSARWHSHTPTTCHSDMWGNVDYSSCVLGGVDAYSCQPSGNDRAKLNALGAPFGLIHCDRRALVPYFPARAGP